MPTLMEVQKFVEEEVVIRVKILSQPGVQAMVGVSAQAQLEAMGLSPAILVEVQDFAAWSKKAWELLAELLQAFSGPQSVYIPNLPQGPLHEVLADAQRLGIRDTRAFLTRLNISLPPASLYPAAPLFSPTMAAWA